MIREIFGEARTRPLIILCVSTSLVAVVSMLFPWSLDFAPFVSQLLYSFLVCLPICAVFGMVLLWRWRVGESLHCPKCDYEFAYGADVAIPHAKTCPECGADWEDRWVKGRREVPWPRFATLLVCAVIGFLCLDKNIAVYTGFGAATAPTWLLLRQLRTDPGTDEHASGRLWSALESRKIDPSTEIELASLAIEAMRRDERPFSSRSWLKDYYRSTRMPAALLTRYLEERFELSGEIMNLAGERRFRLRAVDYDDMGIGSISAVLDRCWIEPDGREIARQDDWFSAQRSASSEVGLEIQLGSPRRSSKQKSLTIALPSDAKGTVKARVWMFWSPGHALASRASPRRLVENPDLDPRIRLVRTIELEVPISPAVGP